MAENKHEFKGQTDEATKDDDTSIMGQNKHTDTLWSASQSSTSNHCVILGDKQTIAETKDILDSKNNPVFTREQHLANAERIVHCVNHFDELLEFAKSFSKLFANGDIELLKAKEGKWKEVADMVKLNVKALENAQQK